MHTRNSVTWRNLCTRVVLLSAALAGPALYFLPVRTAVGGKPPPAGSVKAGMEVLVTGGIFSVPDHTARENPVNASGSHDVCRNKEFSGNGDTTLTLRKTTLHFPFAASPGGCGYDGPGSYRRILSLRFASNPAGPGSTVLFHVFIANNYLIEGAGFIESGQWPPTAASPNLRIAIPGNEARWRFITYGGVSRSCRRGPFALGEDVFVECTRNDSRTDDVCDCPFDYNDADADRVADECDCCPDRENFDQTDSDGDGLGDACDPAFDDADADGVGDGRDNCPAVFNPFQQDADHDGIGDACETP